MRLEALPWMPDQPARYGQTLTVARNCIPAANHYLPFPQTSALLLDGLENAARGVTVAFPTGGSAALFTAFGNFIYYIPGVSVSPVNVSLDEAYGYSVLTDERWRFVQYGNNLLAATLTQTVQSYDLSSLSGNFANLSGAPKARYITRINDFVVLGYIDESPDGETPYRIRWHGFNTTSGLPDITEWTIGLDTRSDFQDIPDLGDIQGLTGGNFGIVLLRRGIARLDYGGQFLFNVQIVDTTIGCEVPGSVVQYRGETYFWTDEGLAKTSGGPAQMIGTERVNQHIRETLDYDRIDEVWAYPDLDRGIIVWLYPTTGDTSTMADRMLIYRPAVDRFSFVEQELASLGPTSTFGLDLDDEYEFPDLDTDTRNLDDPALWQSGLLALGGQTLDGVDGDIVGFTGAPMTATFEWPEMELVEGRRYALTHAFTQHEGGTARVSVRSRERVAADLSTSDWMTVQSDGWFRFRRTGRYHRFRVEMSGGWQSMRAVELHGAPLGWR